MLGMEWNYLLKTFCVCLPIYQLLKGVECGFKKTLFHMMTRRKKDERNAKHLLTSMHESRCTWALYVEMFLGVMHLLEIFFPFIS